MCDHRSLFSVDSHIVADRSIRVHFLNLRDGTPHSAPTSNVLTWEFPPQRGLFLVRGMAITGSRIMIHFLYLDEGRGNVWNIVVWSRRTREVVWSCDLDCYALFNLPQVLDLSSTDGNELVGVGTQAVFLDEFRVAMMRNIWTIAELVVFDTLIPQDHPGYMRRLVYPLEFCDTHATLRVDRDRALGTPNKDEVLLPDPTQVVTVIEFWRDEEPHVLLVMRTQVLVEQVHSVQPDSRVPWDEWGRDAVTIEVQSNDGHRVFTFIHGAQVMIAQPFLPHGLGCYHIRTFDFGKRGRSSLPLRDGADGTERRVLFEDGANLDFEPDDGIDIHQELQSLSDGSLMYLVSCLAHYIGSEVPG